MQKIWIDEGDVAHFDRLTRNGFLPGNSRLYFSARRHTKADVDSARARGYEVGIYRVSIWDIVPNGPIVTGAQWADLLNKDCSRFLGGDGRGIGVQLAVQVDIEEHEPDWIVEFLHRWRRVRAQRDTSWTFEPFQAAGIALGHGDWGGAGIRDEVLASNVRLVPQAYQGNMERDCDHLTVVRDLVVHGFPIERIELFQDAKLPRYAGWNGYSFTQNRLPL